MPGFTRLVAEEPVRVYIYTVVAAIIAILVIYGVVDSTVAPVVLAVVSAVLAVPAVEVARSKVSPVTGTVLKGDVT